MSLSAEQTTKLSLISREHEVLVACMIIVIKRFFFFRYWLSSLVQHSDCSSIETFGVWFSLPWLCFSILSFNHPISDFLAIKRFT